MIIAVTQSNLSNDLQILHLTRSRKYLTENDDDDDNDHYSCN